VRWDGRLYELYWNILLCVTVPLQHLASETERNYERKKIRKIKGMRKNKRKGRAEGRKKNKRKE
jgi:hypothetical protein